MSARDLVEDAIVAPLPPITDAQWLRILDGRKFRILVQEEQVKWAGDRARGCASCKNAGRSIAGSEPWRAWCTEHRCMVSNTHLKLCRQYIPEFSTAAKAA